MASPQKKAPAKPTVAPANAQAGQGQPYPPVDHDAAPAPSVARVKVQATRVCYYDDKRRRAGDVFTISGERWPEGHPRAGQLREFSDRYMELVPDTVPERLTTGAQVLREQNSEIAHNKRLDAHPELGDRPRAQDRGIDDED